MVAGSEGFLTGRQWRGLYRQEVVWGEMVSFSIIYVCTTANVYFDCTRTAW
jgi:hypothetical protein